MDVGGDDGAGSAADIHQRVVDRVTDGTNVFFGGSGGCTDDRGLHQSDSECGERQYEDHQRAQGNDVANRSEPWGRNRAEQEIGAAQD